jgi:hypothetical protein
MIGGITHDGECQDKGTVAARNAQEFQRRIARCCIFAMAEEELSRWCGELNLGEVRRYGGAAAWCFMYDISREAWTGC